MNNLMYEICKIRQYELEQDAQQIYLLNKIETTDPEPVAVKWGNTMLNRLGNALIQAGSYLLKMANLDNNPIKCQGC